MAVDRWVRVVAVALAMGAGTTACAGDSGGAVDALRSRSAAPSTASASASAAPALPGEDELRAMILDTGDLGGFTAIPYEESTNVPVRGCAALDRLTGGTMMSKDQIPRPAREVQASFRLESAGLDLQLNILLGTDTPDRLDAVLDAIDTLVACGTVVSVFPDGPIEVFYQALPPPSLGEESRACTAYYGGKYRPRALVQFSVVRVGPVVVLLAGHPGIVDVTLPRAVEKIEQALAA